MRFDSLDAWLAWLERLHPHTIDMGLERVARVRDALGLSAPPYRTLVVGGTNGKGACAVMLDTTLRAAGHRVGRYLSPHLHRYNERVCVDGEEAGDSGLCAAFDAVDRARDGVTLTYFEFGTLAALEHYRRASCDWVVLEVGLGGRLDATNILEHDAALVVSVGIDHTDWLGEGREAIGFEKAGIYRAGRPAVCADPAPPDSLLEHARSIGAHLSCVGRDYGYTVHDDGTWRFSGARTRFERLPAPSLPGAVQYGNAAAVLATLEAVPGLLPGEAVVAQALASSSLPARMQTVATAPAVVVDVAHNPDAARALADHLAAQPVAGRTIAVCAMLADKQIARTLAALDGTVDHWILAGLSVARGLDADDMSRRAGTLRAPAETRDTVHAALARARGLAGPGDRILVFGSFHTAAEALQALEYDTMR